MTPLSRRARAALARAQLARARIAVALVPVALIAVALIAVASLGLAACAETSAPLPPPEEVLLVLTTGRPSLSVIPVDALGQIGTVSLGGSDADPADIGARGSTAVVPLRGRDALVVVDLRARRRIATVRLPTGSRPGGAAMLNDSIAFVANTGLGTVTRVDVTTGDTASVAVGPTPQDVVVTRGRVFVLVANLDSLGRPAGESWIAALDPAGDIRTSGVDSIPLVGPGNARRAATAPDGLLYVVQAGDSATEPGRLSIVDPVRRGEVASFGGFGAAPGDLGSDGDARLLLSSRSEGVMEFDRFRRAVIRGEGAGVPIPENSGVALDSQGRVYAIEAGCERAGVVHVLQHDFTPVRTLSVGRCAGIARVVRIPPLGETIAQGEP